jgi:protein-disulfide isomerase
MANKSAERAARTAALLTEQRRAESRRRLMIVAAVVTLLAVVVGIGFWVQSTRDTTGETAEAVPAGVTSGYGIVLGEESAPTEITVYEDLQCPVCKVFEDATADRLEQAVEAGEVRVDYRMVSFLDVASTNDYSSRALNAALVVLDTSGVETFKEFHDLLFANQPAEGGPGPEDDQLIQYAVQAGADEAEISGPIEDKIYEQWIKNATEQMSKNAVNGTPTVFIDGEQVEGTPDDAIDAVLAATE